MSRDWHMFKKSPIATRASRRPAASPSARPVALFVREAGQGPPLVMLHGLASSSRYWEPHFDVLGRVYRIIAPDLLGFGRSPNPAGAEYTPAQHLAALTGALERRLDGPATVVGHSMGAIVALHLAVNRPEMVGRLALISPPVIGEHVWGHAPDGGPRRFHAFAVHTPAGRTLFNAGMRAASPVWVAVAPRVRRTVPRGASQDALRGSWTAYWQTLEATVYGSNVPRLFADVPPSVTARHPLLVMHGARDGIVPVGPVRALVAIRSDVQYIEIPDAGHNPAYTHAALFQDALLTGR